MKSQISLNWKQQMAFETTVNGHKLLLDAAPDVGGSDQGPRPKPLMLVALAGCTAMDVVSILEKMRVRPDAFTVDVQGDLTEEHPKVYKTLHITYRFRGKDLPADKIEKAITLSQEKYCGVSAMLSKAAQLSYDMIIED